MRNSLRASVIDSAFYGAMVGISENYMGALAVSLGFNNAELAMLSSLPLLAGACSQLIAGYLVNIVGGRKRLVLFSCCLQAVGLVLLWWIAHQQIQSFRFLLFVKTLYWLGGMVHIPAWNCWIGALTGQIHRERFFAWRSAVSQSALFAAYACGGWVLEAGRKNFQLFDGFAALFVVGAIARMLSVATLSVQQEPAEDANKAETLGSIFERMRKVIEVSHWRVALFIALVQFGSYLAIPFYAPYMLRTWHFDFIDYAVISSISILSKTLAFPFCYKLAAHFGLRRMLLIGACGVSIAPVLWIPFHDIAHLACVQIVSGVAWALFEFAGFQLLFGSSPGHWRVIFFSLSTSMTSVAQVLGGLTGAALMYWLPYGYPGAFVASTLCRALPLLLLLPSLGWLPLKQPPITRFFVRLMSFVGLRVGSPVQVSLERPLLPQDSDGRAG